MAKKAKQDFEGRWRITWMDQWDQDYLDEEVDLATGDRKAQRVGIPQYRRSDDKWQRDEVRCWCLPSEQHFQA